MKIIEIISEYKILYDNKENYLYEFATTGVTSSANIASIANPHVVIGKDLKNKSFTGSTGKSGTKSPKLPKIITPKNSDGTAKNAMDVKNSSIFGGKLLKM